jgi:hypothetical protein
MKVKDVMTTNVRLANPRQTIAEAARLMPTAMPACCRWARTTASWA